MTLEASSRSFAENRVPFEDSAGKPQGPRLMTSRRLVDY
jgi:hypothetical protein